MTFHSSLYLLMITILIFSFLMIQSSWAGWNVKEKGAIGDGVTDNTQIFQSVLDEAAQAGGGIVHVPAGKYVIKGNLVIPSNVTLKGTYQVPPTCRHDPLPESGGSWLYAYAGRGVESASPFIRMGGHNSVVAGLVISYPEVNQKEVPPIPYPPCILAEGVEDVGVLDCLLLNPYEGIKLVLSPRHFVKQVFGYPIKRGLYVDECYDIGRVENCHFWPFGTIYSPEDPFSKWINTEGVAFEFARTDWQYVLNTFCFGYGIGYKFSESPKGSCNGNFSGLGADCCVRPVSVEQTPPYGLLITNGEFVGRWGSQDSIGLEIAPKVKGNVNLVNCAFWGPLDRCVWQRSPNAQLSLSSCMFADWDCMGRQSPAVDLEAGSTIIQGSSFGERDLHIRVGANVRSAIILGNQSPSGIEIENQAGERTQALANQKCPIQWSAEKRDHYHIDIGMAGDGKYLLNWFPSEQPMEDPFKGKTWRWATPTSRLILPVNPGKKYTVRVRLSIREQGLTPDAGFYMNNQCISPVTESGEDLDHMFTFFAPPDSEEVMIELRSKEWIPARVLPGSTDKRSLTAFLVEDVWVRSEGAGEAIFNANTGNYEEGKKVPGCFN